MKKIKIFLLQIVFYVKNVLLWLDNYAKLPKI